MVDQPSERSVSPIARPLTAAQVDAANRLHERIEGWRETDEALRGLRECFPSNTLLAHVLLKTGALNSLYSTKVFAVVEMAKHIVEVCKRARGVPTDTLVEDIAWHRGLGERKRDFYFLSFASKYCRFFVNGERFPIYDSLALEALRFHLGQSCVNTDANARIKYADWCGAIERLRQTCDPLPSYVELDRYLWLLGQWLRFQSHERGDPKAPPVNAEVEELFRKKEDQQAQRLVEQAFAGLGLATT